MADTQGTGKEQERGTLGKAERDIVALGIAIAAIIMFIGSGGSLMPQVLRAISGTGAAPDVVLTNALLLNIALLIFGWRRYRDLKDEIVQRREAEKRARDLAEIDPLTKCLNRRSGAPAIDALCREAAFQSRHVAALMIDLDNFKQINDLNGHSVGDLVLSTTADRLRQVLPMNAVLARLGGDEFVCVLAFDTGARHRVEALGDNLIQAISRPIDSHGRELEVTVSVGIAEETMPGQRDEGVGETLLHRADIAMYRAKKSGRNRLQWFERSMEDEMRFRADLESGIRQGMPAGEFVPYYEQQIDLETGELVGFEMLARWESPQFGIVSPEIFIPIAEEIDLIGELSEGLIRQALRDAGEWDPKLTLSVNISPVQLRDPWFAQKLLQLLVESGFPPNRLEIEITESCLHENIGAVHTIVTSLKNQGIRVSLDDFGTGYSSLSQLRSLPFDRLKIDRSFVTELSQEGGNSRELVEAIISLGKGLAMPITAEGVESAEVLDQLKGMGQLKGQGYLYGRPENANATRDRLAALNLLSAAEEPAVDQMQPEIQQPELQRKAS